VPPEFRERRLQVNWLRVANDRVNVGSYKVLKQHIAIRVSQWKKMVDVFLTG
jgi:hypothetical protein